MLLIRLHKDFLDIVRLIDQKQLETLANANGFVAMMNTASDAILTKNIVLDNRVEPKEIYPLVQLTKLFTEQIGTMILGGGIILLLGMAYCYTLLDKLVDSYVIDSVVITPPLFMGISIPVMIVGIILIKPNKKRPKKEYF